MKGLGLTVFLAAILIGALGSQFLEDVLVKPTPLTRPTPDAPIYFFEDFTMRVMNEEGRPAYVLTGKTLFSYRRDDVDARLEAPRMQIDGEPPQPGWDVTADTGTVTQGGDMVQLRGSVVLVQDADETPTPVRIETEVLDLDTQQRIASTAEPVNITAPQWVVTSLGMNAQFEAGVMDLLADVRARFTPLSVTP